jgi:hypothetical protein
MGRLALLGRRGASVKRGKLTIFHLSRLYFVFAGENKEWIESDFAQFFQKI